MGDWTWVKDKITGHHYDTRTVLPDQHEVLKQPEARELRPRPAKYKTSLANTSGAAEKATNQKADEAKEETS